ncbi:MAG: hypothetical protein Q8P12_04130 [bacterium]|nr:hypothetical protein [bacterium]
MGGKMEITNKYLVGVTGVTITLGLPMRAARMTKEEALVLAAFLVSVATTDPKKEFQPILDALNK